MVYAQTNVNNKSYRPEYMKKKTNTNQNPTKNLRKEKHTKNADVVRLNSQAMFHYYYCYHLSRTFKPVLIFLPFVFITLTVTLLTVMFLAKLSLLKVLSPHYFWSDLNQQSRTFPVLGGMKLYWILGACVSTNRMQTRKLCILLTGTRTRVAKFWQN